jgi:hypothetical protein
MKKTMAKPDDAVVRDMIRTGADLYWSDDLDLQDQILEMAIGDVEGEPTEMQVEYGYTMYDDLCKSLEKSIKATFEAWFLKHAGRKLKKMKRS